jgi:hypothetical protein
MERHGRTRLRGRCNYACTVAIRVRTRLTTGRVIRGPLVKRTAPAGGTLDIRLKRGKLPPRRRAARSAIAGTVKGSGSTISLNVKVR